MSTIREQIVVAALTAVNTARPTGVPAASRTRSVSLDSDQLPALTVYPLLDEVDHARGSKSIPALHRRLTVAFEIMAKESGNDSADKGIDATAAWIVKTLSGNRLAGLVIDGIESKTHFEYDRDSAAALCRATVLFLFDYATSQTDAEVGF